MPWCILGADVWLYLCSIMKKYAILVHLRCFLLCQQPGICQSIDNCISNGAGCACPGQSVICHNNFFLASMVFYIGCWFETKLTLRTSFTNIVYPRLEMDSQVHPIVWDVFYLDRLRIMDHQVASQALNSLVVTSLRPGPRFLSRAQSKLGQTQARLLK